jgi:FMN-dependent NADH-azoreductase
MRLLHVDASPNQWKSRSRELARHFVDHLRRRVGALAIDHHDLAADPPPHVTEAFVSAAYTPVAERTREMDAVLARSDALCSRLFTADALLFVMPMHNWTMPSSFKAYIDSIVRSGVTYETTPDGRFVGRLTGRKVLFLTTRGVDLRPGGPLERLDALTPALRAAFGFIGVTDPIFVDAQPVQFAPPSECEQALDRARRELETIADRWANEDAGAG